MLRGRSGQDRYPAGRGWHFGRGKGTSFRPASKPRQPGLLVRRETRRSGWCGLCSLLGRDVGGGFRLSVSRISTSTK